MPQSQSQKAEDKDKDKEQKNPSGRRQKSDELDDSLDIRKGDSPRETPKKGSVMPQLKILQQNSSKEKVKKEVKVDQIRKLVRNL